MILGFLCIASVVLLVLLIWPISTYNGLVRKRNAVERSFGTIDVMLKKRYDLVPNLVASVKEFMQHERDLLTNITALRERIGTATSPADRMAAESALGSALGQFKVTVENYPDLKSNQNFLQLQAALNEVEEQIAASRRAYNQSVNALNNAVDSFPGNLLAGMFGFKRATTFEASAAERGNVDVGGLFNS